jgi:DNA-binding response OmpR family regulator
MCAQIIELQAAEPAVVQLSAHDLVDEIKKAAAHAVDFVNAPFGIDGLIAAVWTFRPASQLQPRRDGYVIARTAALTTIGFQVPHVLKRAALGTT